jgi:hypothetical protein
MRSPIILSSIFLSLIGCLPSKAADIYSCEAKEHLMLNDDGLVRALPRMGGNPQFMIDKNNGNAVGGDIPWITEVADRATGFGGELPRQPR